MATVDEFKIEFNSEGAQDLANSLKNIQLYAQKAVAKVDELTGKTSNLGGVQDKNSKKKIAGDKKVAKEEVKTQKRTIESNKSLHESLSKIENVIKGVASFSAIKSAFGFAVSAGESSAQNYNDLNNKSKSTSVSIPELRATQLALIGKGIGENALDKFISLFGDNSSKLKTGMGLNAEYAESIARFNGMEQNGLKVDFAKTDFLGVLKDIQKSLSAEKNSSRRLELAKALNLGDGATAFLLTDSAIKDIEDQYKNITQGGAKNTDKNAEDYNKSVANKTDAEDEFGKSWIGAKTSINNAYANALRLLSSPTNYFNKIKKDEYQKFEYLLKDIENINENDGKKGSIKFKDGRVFTGDFGKDIKRFNTDEIKVLNNFLSDQKEMRLKESKKTSSLLSPQVMDSLVNDSINGSFLGASNNSNYNQNQVTNIEELHIHSAATNLDGIMADVSNQVKWTFNEVTTVNAMPYGRVIG